MTTEHQMNILKTAEANLVEMFPDVHNENPEFLWGKVCMAFHSDEAPNADDLVREAAELVEIYWPLRNLPA